MGEALNGSPFNVWIKMSGSWSRPGRQMNCGRHKQVLLPLEFGLTLAQTAQATGVSVGWACQLRRRFILAGGPPEVERPRPGGRRRENMT